MKTESIKKILVKNCVLIFCEMKLIHIQTVVCKYENLMNNNYTSIYIYFLFYSYNLL